MCKDLTTFRSLIVFCFVFLSECSLCDPLLLSLSLSVQPVALTEAQMQQNGSGEPDLPDIKLHMGT